MQKIGEKIGYLNKFSIKGKIRDDTKFAAGWLAQLPHAFVLDKRLSPYDRLVGIYIKMRIYRGKTEAFPSISTIAADLAISRRIVMYATKKLKELNYIAIEQKWGKANKYKVNF